MNTICTVQLQFTKSKMLFETFLSFKYVFIVSVTIQTNFGVCILYTTFHYTAFILKTYRQYISEIYKCLLLLNKIFGNSLLAFCSMFVFI